MNKKQPERMCTVCRQHFPKSELIRVVKDKDGDIFVDFTKKASGRGAYICTNQACLDKLEKTRALNRAFKCEVPDNIYKNIKGEN